MRYINQNKLRLPDNWLARASAAKKAINEGASIDDYDSVWRDLKTTLADFLNQKCWYCESPVERSDNAVDHFRPKNRVYEATKEHKGYRWLAFEYINYRFSCTYCNSKRIDLLYGTTGGKADKFPLLDENKRVYEEGPTNLEEPELLDPCILEDCELLGCKQENGKPCSTSDDPIAKKRVETSIEIYHLNREASNKHRHSIAVGLVSDILDAQRNFDLMTKGDSSKKEDFAKVLKRIEGIISAEAPFSGEMRALFRTQRSEDHPWMRQLLEA